MKKYLSITLAALLVLGLLAGCGAKNDSAALEGIPQENGSAVMDSEMSITESASGTSSPLPQSQKLIRKIRMEAETEDLDTLLGAVKERIAELEGYVEAENIYNGSEYGNSRRYRYANLTIRIPADKLDSFVEHVSGNANIVSSEETVDDVTLSYVATESRIKALETEQTRLLELLAKAESMDDILQIESRLTNVRTELEEVTSQLRVYDNLVSYGTVNLNIDEVREYTVVEEPETVWERIGAGFMENLGNLGDFFVELFVFVVTALPYLVVLAVVAVVIIVLIRRNRRKKKTTKTE